jgi:hypothetical protein
MTDRHIGSKTLLMQNLDFDHYLSAHKGAVRLGGFAEENHHAFAAHMPVCLLNELHPGLTILG